MSMSLSLIACLFMLMPYFRMSPSPPLGPEYWQGQEPLPKFLGWIAFSLLAESWPWSKYSMEIAVQGIGREGENIVEEQNQNKVE
jgi:hypothetical protein